MEVWLPFLILKSIGYHLKAIFAKAYRANVKLIKKQVFNLIKTIDFIKLYVTIEETVKGEGYNMEALAERHLQPVESRNYEDILQMLLEDKRSENTKRAYKHDINDFFITMTGSEPAPDLVQQFLSLPSDQVMRVALSYKSGLIKRGLAEATINRRLAALKAIVDFGRKLGKCSFDLSDVQGEKVQSYRDVSGPSIEQVKAILEQPDRNTLKGKRDYTMLRLLWENALRRNEVVSCNIADYDAENRILFISGKGQGTQKQGISLSEKTAEALNDWLQARRELDSSSPLFISMSNYMKGHRLTGSGLYNLLAALTKKAGISKKLSPHRLRHSAITAALKVLSGDVCKVQQLSRHKSIETVMIYNDRLRNEQGDVSNMLSALA